MSLRDPHSSESLDQWRGIALLLVLTSHGFFFTDRVNGIGRVGVNLFFFISGLLVYRSLNRASTTPWQRSCIFWWRRLRRLYPALLGYLGGIIALRWIIGICGRAGSHSAWEKYLHALPLALSYTVNYSHWYPASFGHLWSLACEMQFYSLAPLLYWAGHGSKTRSFFVYGASIAVLLAGGIWIPARATHYQTVRYHFEVAAWPMMIGFTCEWAAPWIRRLPVPLLIIAHKVGLLLLLLSILLAPFGPNTKLLVIAMGVAVMPVCLISYLFTMPLRGPLGRFAAWCGQRTYSIYLWQQPLTLCDLLPTVYQPLGALASIAIGAGSFHIFEKPYLRTKPARREHAPAQPKCDGIFSNKHGHITNQHATPRTP